MSRWFRVTKQRAEWLAQHHGTLGINIEVETKAIGASNTMDKLEKIYNDWLDSRLWWSNDILDIWNQMVAPFRICYAEYDELLALSVIDETERKEIYENLEIN